MRVLSPAAISLLAGALSCASKKGEALIWRPFSMAPFRNQCFRLTSAPRHSTSNMNQPSCTNVPLFLAVNQHRGKKTVHQSNSWVRASSLRSGAVRRRTELRAKPRADGQEPRTQQLSRQAKLAISVLIDLIGASSYAVPGLGELSDVGWAPISSALILYLYGNSIFAGLAFVEEILPGLDFIPTATIAWFLTNSEVGQNVKNVASGKAGSSTTSDASSPPSSTPTSTPFGNGESGKNNKARRAVDEDLIKSGVIDVEGD